MAFDFPASPSTGDTYTSAGVAWKYNGYAWVFTDVPSAAPVARRYWRLSLSSANGTYGLVSFAELTFYETSGGSAVTGGTLTASATNSGSASNLRDSNTSTIWEANETQAAVTLTHDWGSGVAKLINEIKVQARPSFYETSPRCFIVQSSADGASWDDEWYVVDQTAWTASEIRTFTRPTPSRPAGALSAHVYWRVRTYARMATDTLTIREIEFRAISGGADQATGGTATTSRTTYTGFEASKAFDDNTGTYMETNAQGIDNNTQYQFTSAVAVSQVSFTVNDAAVTKSPYTLIFQYSDDGTNWATAWLASPGGAWIAGTPKVFTRPYS